MDKEHIEQLHKILRMYGTAPVVRAIADDLKEESKKLSQGAIIFQNMPIVNRAARELEACKMARFSHILA